MQANKYLTLTVLIIGMSLIPVGDSAGKLLGQSGIEPSFIAWSRLFVGFLFVLPFAALKLKEINQLFHWKLLVRAGLFCSAIFCILTALKTEPIANVFGIFFIGPIVSYVLAAMLLKEQITLSRSILLITGFIGVLVVVRPGLGMSVGSIFALGSGFFYGCLLVANRWLAGQFRPRLILLSTLLAGSLFLLPSVATSFPAEVNASIVGLILVSSLASAIGNLIIIESSRKLEASIIAPFVYTQLIAAAILGYGLFNDWPDTLSMVGLVIIFTSGVLSFVLVQKKPKVAPDKECR